MLGNLLFWPGLILCVAIGLPHFRDLGDVTQIVLKVNVVVPHP